MRRFSITVNGQAYDVVVEEVNGAYAPAPQTYVAPAPVAAPVAAPAPVSAPAAAPAAAAPAPAPVATAVTGGDPVKSPMPGTILDVKVAVGQSVKKGDVLCIIEAMKLENEIRATRDCVIAGIAVSKGSNVNAGDTLVTMG
jgi:glutaconyl-CoA decarboxylase